MAGMARRSSAPGGRRRIYSMDYEHESSRFEVTVGKPRKEYRRRNGPRGASIENADYDRLGADRGTEVSGIVAAGDKSTSGRTVRHSTAGRTPHWLPRARSDASTTSTTSPGRKPIVRFSAGARALTAVAGRRVPPTPARGNPGSDR